MISEKEIASLNNIVGEEWVSTEPCMMDTYSFYMNPEVLVKDGGRFAPRPVAVVLPSCTEEVREIIELCNRTSLMAKPLSTGFGTWAAASRENVVVLDLKRMNRIIDIDVKNQIAVIEPYVRAIDLQTELFKHGLNVHVVSCGGSHSILASTTAAWGYGVTGSSMSYSGRNLMGVEWVLPTGEVLNLGSEGATKSGWFTADGPGPSLRGIMRGFSGTFGGLGVFTKCAVKLYKWDGPKTMATEGSSPSYKLKEIPPKITMNVISFPSRQAMKDAGYLLGEAEIDFAQFRTPMFFTALGMSDNNQDLKVFLESGVFQKISEWILVNAVVGRSQGEFDWKMKALKEVLKETGGALMPLNFRPKAWQMKIMGRLVKFLDDPMAIFRSLPWLQDVALSAPIFKEQAKDTFSRLFWLLVRNAINTQATFRPSQGMSTTLGSFDTWDLGVAQSDWIAKEKLPVINNGDILDDEGDLGCGGTFENGHMGYLEGIVLYNTKDPKSVMATGELIERGVDASIKGALGIPIAAFGQEMNSRFGPHCSNYHLWTAKLKNALDPKTASDPFFYADNQADTSDD